jgi:acyl-[acyl-carrier-protein]-phospholipid O-acyltransferase/long-chain-fatty-acid--[acyl-carrier-protein] ligase
MKTILRFILRLLFRFRAHNVEALKTPGPVLLLPNHVSWVDWLFLGVCLEDDWKFVTSSVTAQASWLHRWIMLNRRTFPVDIASPFAVKRMAEHLQAGGRLVLFPEGRITRTGSLMKLFDGTGFLLHKTRARAITAYLRGAACLPGSPNPNRKRWFPRVTLFFSDALVAPDCSDISNTAARQRLTSWLMEQMTRQRFDIEMNLAPGSIPKLIAETARLNPGLVILEDSTFQRLTYRRMFVAAGLLARQWRELFSSDTTPGDEPDCVRCTSFTKPAAPKSPPASCPPERVGVLLPNLNALPVTLLSLWGANKVPAILNFSSGSPVMVACARLAGLKHIITSRVFLERAKIDPKPFADAGLELVCLEDVRPRIRPFDRVAALVRSHLGKAPEVGAWKPSDTAVILFTSGSEGVPKGVELSHRNLTANLMQMFSVVDILDSDRVFNALPTFHSFGLTIGTLLPLVRGIYMFLFPSPLRYRVIPSTFYDLDCTIFFGTNTFLNGYARKAHAYDFRNLRYMFAGAEKLQESTAHVWASQFGVRVLEGYGATECSPVVSVNTPLRPCAGTAGHLMPGMEWRVEPVEGVTQTRNAERGTRSDETSPDPDSALRVPRSVLRTGRLFVRGPNVMKGYLNEDANARFQALDGWYDTGDIARVDENGFIHILGRMKRFAKVSGEMVSLTAVEDALAGAFPEFGLRCEVAVIAVPDEAKGEKLIAVANEPRITLEHLRAAIKARGLGNLCVPREIKVLRDIPKLGTGKLNHREIERRLREDVSA